MKGGACSRTGQLAIVCMRMRQNTRAWQCFVDMHTAQVRMCLSHFIQFESSMSPRQSEKFTPPPSPHLGENLSGKSSGKSSGESKVEIPFLPKYSVLLRTGGEENFIFLSRLRFATPFFTPPTGGVGGGVRGGIFHCQLGSTRARAMGPAPPSGGASASQPKDRTVIFPPCA